MRKLVAVCLVLFSSVSWGEVCAIYSIANQKYVNQNAHNSSEPILIYSVRALAESHALVIHRNDETAFRIDCWNTTSENNSTDKVYAIWCNEIDDWLMHTKGIRRNRTLRTFTNFKEAEYMARFGRQEAYSRTIAHNHVWCETFEAREFK